jgi:glycoside/pentoside/hexuronide:cation symporter, GPH family
LLFVACVVCVAACKLNKDLTIKMANELADRRRKAGLAV